MVKSTKNPMYVPVPFTWRLFRDVSTLFLETGLLFILVSSDE